MATYPVDQGSNGSRCTVVADSKIKFVKMKGGPPRSWKDGDEEFLIIVEHFWLSESDKDAIMTFYETYELVENRIVTLLDGSYDGYFEGRPVVGKKFGPWMPVTSSFQGVKV